MSGHFFDVGLRFECTRCSRCCRHEPGYVFLTQEDLDRLAAGLGAPVRSVLKAHCREVGVGAFQRVSLREKPGYDCIFWSLEGCTVYAHRPQQCRSFPFWAANLESEESWAEVGCDCPGIGRGRVHSEAEIRRWLELGRGQRFLPGMPEEP